MNFASYDKNKWGKSSNYIQFDIKVVYNKKVAKNAAI